MICDFYQGYDNFGSFHGRCLANFCENIYIAFEDITVKVSMADVIVICIADTDVARCMRCHSAKWQMMLTHVYGMVLDVMITQHMCAIWLM